MATKNIVPNADSEGGIGTSSKFWSSAYLDGLNIGNDAAANLIFTPSASDTITLASAANGAFTITTVDAAAAAANVGFVVDGNFTVSNVTSTITSSSSDITTFATTNATSGYAEFAYNTSTVAGYIGNGTSLLSGAANTDFIIRSESGALKFTTGGGNLALTIDSSQNVSIGTTQVLSKLNVKNDGNGSITRGLGLYNNAHSGSGTGISIDFYVNAGDNDRCARVISQQESTGNFANLEFHTSNNGTVTKRFTIKSDGNVEIADGSLQIANAGDGINFSATSDGSGTTSSEVLDDYEEGTWTPSYTTSGVSSTVAYNIQNGYYTKVGNQVTCWGTLQTNATTWNGTYVQLDGQPFSASPITTPVGFIPYTVGFSGEYPSGIYYATATRNYLTYRDTSDDQTQELRASDMNTGNGVNTIIFSFTYQAS